jgi:pyroglutamyl-peptidase
MRLWVTGFGPFPGAPINPTGRLMEQLGTLAPEAVGASALTCEVLPVEFSRVQAIVADRHRSLTPDIAVHFGLHREAAGFRLERRAANVIGAEQVDAAGTVPESRQVARDGPPVLRSAWPADIEEGLAAVGIAVEQSDDAGAYVCNAVYYRSLTCVAERSGAWCGFVHVPHTEHSDENQAAIGEADLLAGAIFILRNLTAAKTFSESH